MKKDNKKIIERVELDEELIEIRSNNSKKMETDRENRIYKRVPMMVLEVKGKQYDKVFFAYAKDVSEGGLSIETEKILKVGEQFPIEFVLPDNKTTFCCTCEVIWNKKYDNNGIISNGMGIKFVDLTLENQLVLQTMMLNSENPTDADDNE